MDHKFLVLDSTQAGATDTSDFTVEFSPPIDLRDGNWELALNKLSCWYSWYNISAAQGNNTMRYNNSVGWNNVVIPDGQYSIGDINDYLHSVMKANGDYTLSGTVEIYDIEITPNYATNKVHLEFTNSYQLDLSVSDIYLLMGSASAIYSVSGDLPNNANITNDIDNLWARCSIVVGGGSYLNSITDDIIYTFVPESPPNSNINIIPLQLIYMPIAQANNLVRKMRLYITDNLGRPIDFNGEPITWSLTMRRVA